MVIYQVSFYAENGESFGYEYFSSQREAVTRRYVWLKDNKEDDSAAAEVLRINVECSKAGILKALNRYGKHHDNG